MMFLLIDHKTFRKYYLINSPSALREPWRLNDLPEAGQEIDGEKQN